MENACKFLPHAELPAFLAELAGKSRLVAPRAEGNAVVFREYDADKGIELGRRATESAKHALFPRSEELFSFTRNEEGGVGLTVPEQARETVVFGLAGCDAAGVSTFDPIFGGEKFPDAYYLARREATTFVVLACSRPHATCFCNWTGGSPADTRHADAMLSAVDGGWLLQAVTDKGSALLASSLLKDAGKEQIAVVEKSRAEALAAMKAAPDLTGLDQALLDKFSDPDFWRDQSASCLACGTCTYLCPTCHCFTITDEATGKAGMRIRAWDTCMAALYTLEASGHNPRNVKAARLRNRVGHKFAYFSRNNRGAISCCGCGRCIKSCPSSVDIRAIVLSALGQDDATTNSKADTKKRSKKEAANG